ncbi:MAG: hypothetical protein N2512_12590 [Armatimonadetes bacterium]|nr:hypothetical protein [Armatimonadota bacterium]
MRPTRMTKTVFFVLGALAGVVAIQLLWPLLLSAQAGAGDAEFSVQATVPNHEQKVRVYKPVRPNLSPDRLQQIARSFGMQGQPSSRAGLLALDQGSKLLRIDPNTGAMLYEDTAQVGARGSRNLPNTGQAGSRADQFVRNNDLLPQAASRRNVEVVSLVRQDRQNGPTTTEPHEVHVNYEFKLRGKPVEGPGSKATVVLGENGEVIGFYKAWREVEESREVTTRTGGQALAELRRKGMWSMHRQGGGRVKEVRITKARAAFWAEAIGRQQTEIEPVYIFEGTVRSVDGVDIPFMQKVSAVADKAEETWPSSPSQPPRQE